MLVQDGKKKLQLTELNSCAQMRLKELPFATEDFPRMYWVNLRCELKKPKLTLVSLERPEQTNIIITRVFMEKCLSTEAERA